MRTCATASRVLSEPLAATAATARTWLLIEQPGPWGSKALTESHLDPALGAALDRAAAPHGVRVALIRRPGPHADRGEPHDRRIHLAHTAPGVSWVLTRETAAGVDPVTSLPDMDFAALGAGIRAGAGPGWHDHRGDPLALVCTNGKRDRCCALLGRPLAAELAASAHADVWEITHIGGHRFSPTLLVLPYGYAYGRAAAHTVKSVLEAVREGRVVTEGCRGRSVWDRPGQAADLAVREATGEQQADALDVVDVQEAPEGSGGQRWAVTVVHRDGRRWRVHIAAVADDAPQAAPSCGAVLGLPPQMRVEAVEALVPVAAAPAGAACAAGEGVERPTR
ncbi:sucrase ferredoxin [Streptomyces sp. RKND-216]|uniref:sucrase ferredoxin n=1 Tax=Streptomyces sp. RKND-216 TaxID=2562581 RepID=UPI00109DB36C|nr:sucrase ferredoxin [Streptomyces sp. RKND-216]THA24136.1 sucrase ferredoxin [Streptomyces sp. RKND-216]